MTMPSIVIITSGLLAIASGSNCLSDAIPAAQRQSLVNMNGETYPVGFYIANYAASFAANHLGAQLVEEVMGFNSTLNLEDLGSGNVAGYYAVTGCKTPNDVKDRGCLQGATRYHVNLEAWMGVYPADWNTIQKTYASVAPKNLGSMGYTGFTTMYIPSAIQNQAYSMHGKSLQYYRAWNTSWNQPWNFFTDISTVNKSKLAPCSKPELVMSSDPTMRRHVEFTGDVDGVVITNDVYAARCDDGYFWTPPSCRSTPSQCIPWITGGVGWDVEAFMQKFTIFQMPVAIAVAASWGDYTTVPLSGNMPLYWWSPDPTFLELTPMVVKFPPHNSRQFTQNIYTSEASGAVVSSLVSQDLAILAPTVQRFIDNIDLPKSHMDAILLDQKNTGDSWDNVTCRWMQANRAVWEAWIPDESACFPGFGLYDSVLKDFTDERVNATNKITCQACAPGTASQKLEDNKGETYICIPCAAGSSQGSGASLSCKPCKEGEYQDELGGTECKRCDFGTYQDETGQVACTACPSGTSTLGFGSVARSDCGCAEKYINMNKTGGFECVACSEGMTCPALSQVVDLERGESNNGEQFTPRIQKGYYSTMDAPTEVYRCGTVASCPGGTPGSCAGGLTDTPCANCEGGSTWTGDACEDCAGWRQVLWVLAVVSIFAFLILTYYLTTSKVTAKATVLFATTASFGMLVMSMQNMGLIGMMTVEWPVNISGIFSICQFLLLDIDSYGFSCVAGQSEVIRYLLSALIFPVGVAWLALCWAVSQLASNKRRWEGPKVVSCAGAFLQVGFSTMSATSLAPMMCYKHPNGLRSVLKYPGVICGTAEHSAMLVIAWLLLIFFVFGFVALCGYAAVKVPAWSAKRKDHLVASVRFLVFRFRLDSWWFGVPLLVRGPLINLPVVLATDYPPIQIVLIAMILTTMMVTQMLSWPWKVPMLNVTDCTVSFAIVLLVTSSTLFLDELDESMYDFSSAVSTAMLGGILVAIMVMFGMTASALVYRSAMGGKKELRMFNLGLTPASDVLASKVKELVGELEKIEVEDLATKLQALSVFDVQKVTSCITLLATEVAPPAENGRSYKFNKRIASHSFDPTLTKSKQSLRVSREIRASRSKQSIHSASGEMPKEVTGPETNVPTPFVETISAPEQSQRNPSVEKVEMTEETNVVMTAEPDKTIEVTRTEWL